MSSPDLTIVEISSRLGISPDATLEKGEVRTGSVVDRPSKFSSWEIVETADDEGDVTSMLLDVCGRLEPFSEALRNLGLEGCSLQLSVVQYLSRDDRTGAGFAVELPVVRFLASVEAEMDIDQYVV